MTEIRDSIRKVGVEAMTMEEVEQSGEGNPESINNDPVVEKGIQMEEEKPRVDKEEVGKDESEGEAEKEDDVKENEELEDDKLKNLRYSLPDVSTDARQESHLEASHGQRSDENIDFSVDAVEKDKVLQEGNIPSNVDYSDGSVISTQQGILHDEKKSMKPNIEEDVGVKLDISDSLHHQGVGDETNCRTQAGESPSTQSPDSSSSKIERKEEVKDGTEKEEDPTVVEKRNSSNLLMFDTDTSGGGDSGTEIEQAAFIMELQKFQKERGLDFKSPKFYGEPLNLLKLWRAVRKLGGYDKVTACKYWRPVGESFNPPKTCTTISWTFRIFYEKALLDYERFRGSADGTCLPAPPVPMVEENQAPGSGRARRDAATRAMQGWHPQRVLDNGEVSDPIDKDKNSVSLNKKEKPLKSLDSILKRKNPSSTDDAVKSVQTKEPKIQSDATVIDIGSPADWVKINVRATRDCYEVYALVPGLLREEVRVQSDPAGRLVISGEPENPDDPWNVTPFKKVVSLPSRIDPHQTSAVVTLHGQLFVRVPFEHYD